MIAGMGRPSPEPCPPALVAIDLDGTLLRSDKQVTQHTAAMIQAVQARGVRVVLASARPPRTCRELHQRLGLDTYQINYNGALIQDVAGDRAWYHRPLACGSVRRIVQYARRCEPEVTISLEVQDQWHTDRVDSTWMTESARHEQPHRLAPLSRLLDGPVTKCMLLAEPERLAPVHQAIRRRFGWRVRIHVSDHHLIQIVHPRVDKARALKRLARHYGIPRAAVMALGDAPNDAGMLRWAGLGVAVDNAWPQVQAAADVLTASNDHEGVAQALERYVLDHRSSGKTGRDIDYLSNSCGK
jgi:Cof subfamily protein (haloacid dehalogenase superfamily)